MRALIVALVVLTALSFGPKPLGASTAVARSYTCQPQPYPPAAPLRLRGGAGKLTRAQKKLFQDLSQQVAYTHRIYSIFTGIPRAFLIFFCV
jgi:hypothetical protein